MLVSSPTHYRVCKVNRRARDENLRRVLAIDVEQSEECGQPVRVIACSEQDVFSLGDLYAL